MNRGSARLRSAPAGLSAPAAITCAVLLLAGSGLPGAGAPARAQAAGPATPAAATVGLAPTATVPAVERFDPSTGRRERWTVAEPGRPALLAVQAALARAGHAPGTRSGALDAATRSALRSFQRARGLEACGCPSYATVVTLGLEPRVVETVLGSGASAGFGHGVTGPPWEVTPARQAGVAVVRGTGSEGSGPGSVGGVGGAARAGGGAGAEGGTGAVGAQGGARAGGAPGLAGRSSRVASPAERERDRGVLYPAYPWDRGPGVLLLPGARRPHDGRRREPPVGRERPPIPYAPRLPEPRPAGPGVPSRPGSGSGSSSG